MGAPGMAAVKWSRLVRRPQERATRRVTLSEHIDDALAFDIPIQTEAATRTIRVLTYNILTGGWPRRDAIEAVIRDTRADIIALDEASPETLEALANSLGMYSAFSQGSPHGWSVGLLSRWPLQETHQHANSPLNNALLEAVIVPDGAAPLRIFAAHLTAHYSHWRAGEGQRLRELAYILDRMRATEGDGAEHILLGDFNSLAPGERLLASQLLLHAAALDDRRGQGESLDGLPTIAKVLPRPLRPLAEALIHLAQKPALAAVCDFIAGRYTPRAVVRQTRAAGYIDLYAATHPDLAQREGSCPSHDPAGRIDYIFASPALASRLVACEVLSDSPTRPVSRASDHRPVLATLALAHSDSAPGADTR